MAHYRIRTPLLLLITLVSVAAAPAARSQGTEEEAWQALRQGGAIAVMRHAIAPGTGDPEGFRLADCSTQRNLSQEGRDQARAIGKAFRDHSIAVTAVYSSQWCRSLETAKLLGVGEVEPLPALNSFYEAPEQKEPQMATLRQWLDEEIAGPVAGRGGGGAPGAIVLVTHQVVVSALTGVYPRSGETVVARPLGGGRVEVVGRLPPP